MESRHTANHSRCYKSFRSYGFAILLVNDIRSLQQFTDYWTDFVYIVNCLVSLDFSFLTLLSPPYFLQCLDALSTFTFFPSSFGVSKVSLGLLVSIYVIVWVNFEHIESICVKVVTISTNFVHLKIFGLQILLSLQQLLDDNNSYPLNCGS